MEAMVVEVEEVVVVRVAEVERLRAVYTAAQRVFLTARWAFVDERGREAFVEALAGLLVLVDDKGEGDE